MAPSAEISAQDESCITPASCTTCVLNMDEQVKSNAMLSCLQMLASSVVNSGTGVYWLFYAGGDFAETSTPAGLPGFTGVAEVEGLRCRRTCGAAV